MSAACVRAKMLVDDGAAEDKGAQELADLFCRSARRRVERHFHDLWHNDDAQNYEAALRILEGHYLWAEEGVLDPSLLAPVVNSSVGAAAER